MTTGSKTYGKPSMTNLPVDLGRRIFNTIMNTPKPDDREVDRKASEIEDRIRAARSKKND